MKTNTTDQFIIIDWANNHCFKDKVFDTFGDACVFLYEEYPNDDQQQDRDEYEVVRKSEYQPNKFGRRP